MQNYPHACKDSGRLRAGAAVGVHDYDQGGVADRGRRGRAGGGLGPRHSANVIGTVKNLGGKFDMSLIAGNVATTRGPGPWPNRARTP